MHFGRLIQAEACLIQLIGLNQCVADVAFIVGVACALPFPDAAAAHMAFADVLVIFDKAFYVDVQKARMLGQKENIHAFMAVGFHGLDGFWHCAAVCTWPPVALCFVNNEDSISR